MSALRLDGRAVRDAVADDLRARTDALPRPPRLVFVRAGDDPASAYYVRSKERFAARVGVESDTIVLPAGVAQDELERTIEGLSADDAVDGILVQLPLPKQVDGDTRSTWVVCGAVPPGCSRRRLAASSRSATTSASRSRGAAS